jgi:GT2 family glycosyltransferase
MTVVIPVWNRRDLLAPVMATLHAQTAPPARIVVVDDGSTDGAAAEAERLGAEVLRQGRNRGFAAAVNRGIRECGTDLVAIVNNDVTLEPDYLERLGRVMEESGIWFATGKILNARDPRRIDGTFDLVARSACAWRAGNGMPDGPVFSQARRIWSAPATAVIYRRELFERIGAFDETLESYLEDVELGMRCAAAGLGGWYEPAAVAYHQGSATSGIWSAETTRRISRNQVVLAKRYFGLTWPVAVGQVLWGVVAARHGRFGPWLRGKMEGFRAAGERAQGRFAGDDGEIRRLQEAAGADRYWKWYFALT